MSLLQLASHANSEELHFELEFRLVHIYSILIIKGPIITDNFKVVNYL